MTDRRFIEESFPVKEVGVASAREKSIRHGHISTLHIWWARRPLAASRATAYAALTPAPKDVEEWQRRRDFIIQLAQWENSNNQSLLDRARDEILAANGGVPPRVLDPFSGGGSYPLEALRLGCEAYANDYNPVAVLLLKATLEYPQRFGRSVEVEVPSSDERLPLGEKRKVNPLLEAVRHWGNWVLVEARKELAEFYPADADGSIPVGYIWARTICCQNPSCGAEIPLMRQFWLASRDGKSVALYPEANHGAVTFRIVGDGHAEWPAEFDADKGTISGAVAACLVCGGTVDQDTTRSLFKGRASAQRLLAVVLHKPGYQGKTYRLATSDDLRAFACTKAALSAAREQFTGKWGVDPVPDEPLPPVGTLGFRIQRYGMMTWGDLFNARQKLALVTFTEKVREAHAKMLQEGVDSEVANAVTTYLALGVDRLADFGSSLCILNSTGGRGVVHTFGRQALQMTWDYAESNPFNPEGAGWPTACEKNEKWIANASGAAQPGTPFLTVTQCSATRLPYESDSFDAILTDPPYYDNVPYAYLSDFFYVWLLRAIGHVHPELFATPLTPKSEEIVAYSHHEGGARAGKEFFERMLKLAFQEMYRVLKANGVAVIVYSHKSTAGWETTINALLDSGLVITSAWPLNTEMAGRLRAQDSAALASSIYIVSRKLPRRSTGFYNDVREELRQHLDTRLQQLWEEGISGADFFIAAIGSGIEVFGRYEQVIDYEGTVVRADRLLTDVRTLATDYAVRQILHDGFGGQISSLTRFYVLWRWEYKEALVPFDEAHKLAQSCGLDLAREWGRASFIRKEKEFVRVLGPQLRTLESLEDKHELVDVLHRVLLLWEKSQRSALVNVLAGSGFAQSEAFYRVAQAVSETLPNESREKKLLDGFLTGRERLREEAGRLATQTRLTGI
ncbi:MAG: DUF1156 domain-containing protein [Chloroflexi bacterium]|nr:DUF1156 domain-containing protein [Chloroflexota bacterium]